MKHKNFFSLLILLCLSLLTTACVSEQVPKDHLSEVLASNEFNEFISAYETFLSNEVSLPNDKVRSLADYDVESLNDLKKNAQQQLDQLQIQLANGSVTSEQVRKNESAFIDQEIIDLRQRLKTRYARLYEAKKTFSDAAVSLKEKFPALTSEELQKLVRTRINQKQSVQ